MNNESIVITPHDSPIEYKYENGSVYYKECFGDNHRMVFNMGIMENTLDNNNDYLKNLILVRQQMFPGIKIRVQVIGCITYDFVINDVEKRREILLSMPEGHEIENIMNVKNIILENLKTYFKMLAIVKNKKIKNFKFSGLRLANNIYSTSHGRYNAYKYREKQKYKQRFTEKVAKKFNLEHNTINMDMSPHNPKIDDMSVIKSVLFDRSDSN